MMLLIGTLKFRTGRHGLVFGGLSLTWSPNPSEAEASMMVDSELIEICSASNKEVLTGEFRSRTTHCEVEWGAVAWKYDKPGDSELLLRPLDAIRRVARIGRLLGYVVDVVFRDLAETYAFPRYRLATVFSPRSLSE